VEVVVLVVVVEVRYEMQNYSCLFDLIRNIKNNKKINF
jgi:hypothetical protein